MIRAVLLAVCGLGAAFLASPSAAEEPEYAGHLRAVYSWNIPFLPGCGAAGESSCRVPFEVENGAIRGVEPLDLVPLTPPDTVDGVPVTSPPASIEPVNEIAYSYACGACTVSGHLRIVDVSGSVTRFAGEEYFRFAVSYVDEGCEISCPFMELDCSYSEPVVDQFMTPIEDEVRVDREENVTLEYLLRLE